MEMNLNGTPVVYTGDRERSLLDWLRNDMDIVSPQDGGLRGLPGGGQR